jgi:hypothetical protein
VQEALNRAARGRTTIVIAHRLSTIRHAHKVVVMRKGEIVEQGTYDELLSRGGYFAELVAAQEVRTENGASSSASAAGASSSASSSSPRGAPKDAPTMVAKHLEASGAVSTVVPIPSGDARAAGTSDSSSSVDGAPVKVEELSPKELEQLAKKANVPMMRLFKMQIPEWHLILFGLAGAALNGAHSAFPLFFLYFFLPFPIHDSVLLIRTPSSCFLYPSLCLFNFTYHPFRILCCEPLRRFSSSRSALLFHYFCAHFERLCTA